MENEKRKTVAEMIHERDVTRRLRAEQDRERMRTAPAQAQFKTRRMMSEIVEAMKPLFPHTKPLESFISSLDSSVKKVSFSESSVAVIFVVLTGYFDLSTSVNATVTTAEIRKVDFMVPMRRGLNGEMAVDGERLAEVVSTTITKALAGRR